MLDFVLDPTWFLVLAPVLALAIWARRRVSRAVRRARMIAAPPGLTASGVALAILEAEWVEGVAIVEASDDPADYFDAGQRTLRLARPEGETMADLAIAAFEAGHAIAWARGGRLARWRRPLVFAAALASDTGWLLNVAGFALAFLRLTFVGAVALAVAALAGLAGRSIGRDAAARARRALAATGLLDADRERAAADLLDAMPWSPVAVILPLVGPPSGRPRGRGRKATAAAEIPWAEEGPGGQPANT